MKIPQSLTLILMLFGLGFLPTGSYATDPAKDDGTNKNAPIGGSCRCNDAICWRQQAETNLNEALLCGLDAAVTAFVPGLKLKVAGNIFTAKNLTRATIGLRCAISAGHTAYTANHLLHRVAEHCTNNPVPPDTAKHAKRIADIRAVDDAPLNEEGHANLRFLSCVLDSTTLAATLTHGSLEAAACISAVFSGRQYAQIEHAIEASHIPVIGPLITCTRSAFNGGVLLYNNLVCLDADVKNLAQSFENYQLTAEAQSRRSLLNSGPGVCGGEVAGDNISFMRAYGHWASSSGGQALGTHSFYTNTMRRERDPSIVSGVCADYCSNVPLSSIGGSYPRDARYFASNLFGYHETASGACRAFVNSRTDQNSAARNACGPACGTRQSSEAINSCVVACCNNYNRTGHSLFWETFVSQSPTTSACRNTTWQRLMTAPENGYPSGTIGIPNGSYLLTPGKDGKRLYCRNENSIEQYKTSFKLNITSHSGSATVNINYHDVLGFFGTDTSRELNLRLTQPEAKDLTDNWGSWIREPGSANCGDVLNFAQQFFGKAIDRGFNGQSYYRIRTDANGKLDCECR